MPEQPFASGSLFKRTGGRKYLNASERSRFVQAASEAPPKERLFCLMLRWSGARISEVLALVPISFDIESGVATFQTLKRRKAGIVRQVPLPPSLLRDLDAEFGILKAQADPAKANRRLWKWSRTTAWRRVKRVMAASRITGAQAMPKGLRHGFGVSAFELNVPPHIVQRWLGHASLRTTALYAEVLGPEERAFAARMWGPRVLRLFSSCRRLLARCGPTLIRSLSLLSNLTSGAH
jgi:integrase/recombinase XerD